MSTKTRTPRPYRMVRRLKQTEATSARLLDAAWTRFSTLPYESVRLSDVAGDADVSVQTLHTHFGTKEELFTSALRRWMVDQGSARVDVRVGDVVDIVRVLYANYEDQAVIGLRIQAQEERIPAVREHIAFGRLWQRQWIAHVFAPYLEAAPKAQRHDLHEALIVTCDIHTWQLLRVEIGHSAAVARRIVVGMLRALTAP